MKPVIDTAHSSTRHTFEMSEYSATLIHEMVRSDIAAHKNWIASAVERGEPDHAKELVVVMRRLERIAAAFNMPSKRDNAARAGTPLVTTHTL